MTKKLIQGKGHFTYSKAGICENPETLLDQPAVGGIFYSLAVADSSMGWIIGYSMGYQGRAVDHPVKGDGEFYGSRDAACQELAQKAITFFTGIDQPELADLDKFIKKHLPKVKRPKKETAKVRTIGSEKKQEDQAAEETKEYEIMAAAIKDDFCNYHYKINSGKMADFTHKVTNSTGIIDDDMKEAFSRLAVHLAVIDDIFKHSNLTIEDINTMHTDELATLYQVTGFKMKGGPGNWSVVLIGNKYLSGGSRMELESPKISIDNLSSYKWWDELNTAIEACRMEVQLYHEGKFTIKEKTPEPENIHIQLNAFTDQGDGLNHDSDFDEPLEN